MASNHLYLVDGSGYIFRAYHQLPPLTNRHGLNVGAVYGYTAMLWKLADALHKADGPTHLAVVLDKGSHTFRNEMYDQYKAHRPPPPEDLIPQFPLIRTATRAFSLPCIEEDGFEADDIIATYTCRAVEAGWNVTIVSSDKDLAQLIQPGRVDMLDTMKNERRSTQYVIDKFGVGPERLGDVLALMGDSVDNVPGVPGIGPKTASKLITEYGDLEGVIAAIPAMKPSKMRDNLAANVEMALLSRKLVALHCDMTLPQELDSLKLDGIPPDPLRAFLEDQGFKTLLSRMTGELPMARPANLVATTIKDATDPASLVEARTGMPALPELPQIDCSAYATIADEAALDAMIAEAYRTGLLAIDTETDALDSVASGLVGISLATAPGHAAYVPVGHISSDDMFGEKPQQLSLKTVADRLAPVLADPAVLKIGHNIKYDMNVLARHGLVIAPYDDSMVMSFDLDSGKMLGGHGMDVAATTHLAHTCTSFKDV
ncbi:MAG TPA: 5'-3' exonuclease H3TH domain-containing protein, partial [Sphingomonas sp.]